MAFTPPVRDQIDWDDEMNDTLQWLRVKAEQALASAQTAVASATVALQRAEEAFNAVAAGGVGGGGGGSGTVTGVNGKLPDGSGVVNLSPSDVGALPDSYAPSWGDVTGKPSLSTVATSGAYGDLSGTPDIPTQPSDLGIDLSVYLETVSGPTRFGVYDSLPESGMQEGDVALVRRPE